VLIKKKKEKEKQEQKTRGRTSEEKCPLHFRNTQREGGKGREREREERPVDFISRRTRHENIFVSDF